MAQQVNHHEHQLQVDYITSDQDFCDWANARIDRMMAQLDAMGRVSQQ